MGARVGTAPITGGLILTPLPRHCVPITRLCVRVVSSHARPRFLAVAAEKAAPPSPPLPPSPLQAEDSGPIELSEGQDPFAIPTSGVSPLQSAASILVTGTLAVFLYRSLRRRAKLAQETKFRSSGVENVKESSQKEAISTAKPEAKITSPPSAFQTLLGAVLAGAIALVLYKFATYVEAGFASKPVSPVYTIRQLTVTIRTIVNGLCYLATFVFAANSIGLTVYSLQLLFNLGPTKTTENQDSETVTDKDSLETESLEEVQKK